MMKRFFPRLKTPEIERCLVMGHMPRPAFHRLRLERFPRGIDSSHIDVALDAGLVDATMALVKNILRKDVQHYFWQQSSSPLDPDIVEIFRRAYADNTRMVLRQAHSRARPETAQLFQLAIIRLLLVAVDRQLGLLRQELDDARAQPARQHSGQSLELHDKVVILARNEQSVRYRVLHDVLRIMMRLEDSSLRKTRKTIMGISWPISREMLTNPLLRLGGMGSNEDFCRYYPHILRNDAHAVLLNRTLFEVLSEWLPDEFGLSTDSIMLESTAPVGSGYGLRGHAEIERRASLLIDQGELAQMIPHEFDNASAVLVLLGGDAEPWPQAGPWEDEDFTQVQRAKVKEWIEAVNREGLMSGIRASYLLKSIYPRLGTRGGVDWVYEYLAGNSSARELVRRLQTLQGVSDARPLLRIIDEMVDASKQEGPHADQRLAVRFIADMVRFRYHLKLASWMYAGLSSLRLLHDERKISMSAANGLLQDFRYGKETSDGAVIGHVVLKADVRGSTEITAQMRARNLNPAAYFSRSLYDPITQQLKTFGAEKVFVEGDAVILSLMEYEGQPQEHLAVARACGLAQRILQVVQSKNAESRELGLPQLGLGIGIAYSNEAPTYLFDEGHKIMISSAINRADRLSSCHAALKKLLGSDGDNGRRVVVAVPVAERGESAKSDQQDVLRYNINGVALEAAAFFQLSEELRLRRVRLTGSGDSADRYHVGRYLDPRGNSHWLVIREAPLPLWMGGRLIEGDRSGRVYYEVVSDPDIIASARREMRDMVRRR